MRRFILGLLGLVVVWIAGLAPQFLAYAHVSGIIIFALEGGISIAGYLLYVRLVEKRSAVELSHFRIALLALGTLIGLVWFGLLMAMLYARGHYQISGFAFPNRLLSALIFALGTAIWEEVTFRGLLFRVTEQTFGTWVGVAVSAVAFGALHGLNPNASLAASVAIILESGVLLAAAFFATRTLWFPIGLHFRLEFCRRLHLWSSHVGARRTPGNCGWNADGFPLLDRWHLRTRILDLGDRDGSILSGVLIAVAIRRREIVPFIPARTRA